MNGCLLNIRNHPQLLLISIIIIRIRGDAIGIVQLKRKELLFECVGVEAVLNRKMEPG
jgi:hypothetical protein